MRNVGRARVVLDERLGLPLIHLQPLAHDPVAIVGALHERTAALAAIRRPLRRRVRAALRSRSVASPAAARARLPAPRCRARPAARDRPSSRRARSPARRSAESRRARTRTARPVGSSRSRTMAIITSSPTSLPASIVAFASRPSSVSACTASRRMSPVEIFGSPCRAANARPGCPCRPRRTEHHHVQRRTPGR